MTQSNGVLGKTFSALLDESELDQMVRTQLIEIAAEDYTEEEPSPDIIEESAAAVAAPVVKVQEVEESAIPQAEEATLEDIPVTGGMVTIDDLDLFDAFLQESDEHLNKIEEKILKFEQTDNAELVDEIFRAMHTIKGSASFFGFASIELVSHRCESLLHRVREKTLSISTDLIDVLLSSADILTKLIDGLRNEVAPHRGSETAFEVYEGRIDINPLLKKISTINSVPSEEREAPSAPEFEYKDLITDEMVESYISESLELLEEAEKNALDLEDNPESNEIIDRMFRAIHTIKGNAGFLGYESHEQICTYLEDFLTELRDGESSASQRVVTTFLRSLDTLEKLIADSREKNSETSKSTAPQQMGELLVEMGVITEDDIDQALELQGKKVGEILIETGKVSKEVVDKALEKQNAAARESGVHFTERRDIRVDVKKLDKLFDLMGELITAEAIVVKNPELEGLELEGFKQAANYLGKITRQMQEITMSVRMIPLEGLFNKSRRAVRDLSKRFDKDIEVITEGQETEMDRNVIEELSDPLTHLIRNAIDHGIEEREERVSKGKSPKGKIYLQARYEGSEIWITIKDDGRGINRKSVLKKAIEQSLVRAEEAESLTDEQVWNLLFEPGFSTADKVSEISGRGVGMDVVKQNIEKLKGKIDISTVPGAETEILLKIPLSLSIIDGIILRVGNIHYAIPLGDVREFQRAQSENIKQTSGNIEILKLREEIIPIIRLSEFFKAETAETQRDEGVFLIIQNNNHPTALLVDEIIGYQQVVVKALPEYIGQMNGISGCSILGNGDVTFIINTNDLIVEELF